jgi:formylglycine-generating enzyme required for sulfatase activity
MGTDRGQEDERPPHRVYVDRFELAVFPVTRAEYGCFASSRASNLSPCQSTRNVGR